MIKKIANNERTTEVLNLHPIADILEKLNYYRSLFGKIQDLPEDDFNELKHDIATFFNIKIGSNTQTPPERLVRISINNQILYAQGKELSYLTDISQLLAPPIERCGFGRCNIPKQQVLYCATSEAGAYWEIKPKNGDVITLSHFELKSNAKVKCAIVTREKTKNPKIDTDLHQVYYALEDFFVDVYSLEVSRTRPRDYLFSALLSSEQLFYPVVAENNFEAILYPNVQKQKFGENVAIRNDLMLERYNLIAVETRFILDEYENLDATSEEVTTDQVIGSFYTSVFNFDTGKILYNEQKVDEIFKIFRQIQTGEGKQIRYEHEGIPKNIAFNLSPQKSDITSQKNERVKIGRNSRVNVVYQEGSRKDNVKFKTVQLDIEQGKCRLVRY